MASLQVFIITHTHAHTVCIPSSCIPICMVSPGISLSFFTDFAHEYRLCSVLWSSKWLLRALHQTSI